MKIKTLANISSQVKTIRRKSNLSQTDLALFSGVSRKFISDLENEKQTHVVRFEYVSHGASKALTPSYSTW